ncbi:hypothetical protein [Escherichia phage P479]|uniref:Uncharacterized protein gp30.4 n=1 Tax=Shigella phage SP18 TaxID=645664 RepID=E3SF20_BPSP8|nr:hypothetical protein SP18_gp217 [Shigella phage SP18]ADO19557.1 hypothetical protein SP18gp217 [Shigella phage SP18]QWQ55928.1 hypothetical protein [Escherichia phage P479]
MFKKLIQKILGTEMVEVTYSVIDHSPYLQDNKEKVIKKIILKKHNSLSIEDRLPGYGHWADVDIISVKDV